MKQIISGLLAAALAVSLISCGNSISTDVETDEISAVTEDSPSETTVEALNLPAKDMNGKTFTILSQGWANYAPLAVTDVCVEEMTGEIMDDTAYKRISDISDKYNCNIAEVYEPSGGVVGETMLQASVMAGDNAYDMALIRSCRYNTLLTTGTLLELSGLSADFSKPWYISQSYDALSIGGKHYGIVSNVTMNPYLLIFCTYYNKVIAENFKINDIYDTVRNGKWTIDYLYAMGKKVAADLDSNGTYDVEDRFGITYIVDVPEGILGSCGIHFAESDRNGNLTMTYNTETAVSKMQHIMDILKDTATTFNVHARVTGTANINKYEVGMFIEGHTLFSMAGIYYAPQFRDMKDDFGILPMPKYDEKQENYISPMFSNVYTVTVVPASNTDLENTSILLDELSYRGYRELLPALYDTVLTGKCTRDEDSVEMLDMIFSNTDYDLGMTFDFGKIRTSIRTLYQNLDDSFASTIASAEAAVKENVNDLLNAVKELK